jgi:hypothetical protein
MRTLLYYFCSIVASGLRCRVRQVVSRPRLFAKSLFLTSFFLVGSMLCAQVPVRLAQSGDGAQSKALPNHHPQWANPGNDAGLLPPGLKLDGMTIVLSRSPEQQAAFEKLLADQQNPASPDYHRWLSPAEVGERFGLSTQDVDSVTGWLRSQGLHVNWVSPSRIFIGFGGTAADLGRAFRTEFHYYKVNGVERISVSSDPMIPEALTQAIKAVQGMYTIDDQPLNRIAIARSDSPQMTTGNGTHYIAPVDFATIYDIPLGLNAPGETIGIVGRSRTDFADFQNFMRLTGSTFSLPTEVIPTAFGGVDPGPPLTSPQGSGIFTGDQSEATLDVLRAGSVAPDAKLLLVVATEASGGIEVDAQYLVQTSPVPAQVMNISFGECELSAGKARVDFWDTLFQQAAAEGISSFVSSGDAGASGCDTNFETPPAYPAPDSPNYICSSSYATCVGGTEFNDAGDASSYWSQTNGPNLNSAYSYIPEGAWNEPLTGGSGTQAASSGGGVSTVIPTPVWQTGTGVPAARKGRYTPDIAFSASCHDGYFGCFAAGGGSCAVGENGTYYYVYFCGTSAAAPSMAGIAAILDQEKGGPQGNLNPGLYLTAATSSASFHDVTLATSGVTGCNIDIPSMCNNSIPSPTGLTGGQAGYMVGTGYDEVTGLGSLDVGQFLTFYEATITPTVTVTPPAGTVTFQQALTVAVTVSGADGRPVPTGSVTLASGKFKSAATVLTAGKATIGIPAGSLGTGSQFLNVTYKPDSASAVFYGIASGSGTVFISQLDPKVTLAVSSSKVTTAQAVTATVTVSGGAGDPTPTGLVYLENYGFEGTLKDGAIEFNLPAGTFLPGTDTVTAYYQPDSASSSTYNSNTGSKTLTVTATAKYTPTVSVTPAKPFIAQAQPLEVTIEVSGKTGNPVPTGSVRLISGSYSSAAKVLAKGSATITVPAGALAAGNPSLISDYAPDSASSKTYDNASGLTSVNVVSLPKVTPAVNISTSSTVTTKESLRVLVGVYTLGSYPSATGTITLTSGAYSSGATTLNPGDTFITIPAGSLAAGTDTLTAKYVPDANSSGVYFGASNTARVTVTAPGGN